MQLESFQMTILSDGAFRVSRDFFWREETPRKQNVILKNLKQR